MKYLLLIRIDDTEPGPAVLMPAYDSLTEELRASGNLVRADRLAGPPSVSTLRLRDGKPLVVDGPYSETKEWLCGAYLVSCRDKGEALAIATRIPSAPYGVIEVVPVIE